MRLILKIYKNSFIKQYLFLFCFMVPIEKAKKCTLKMPQSLVRLISCEKFVFLDVLPSIVCACEFESLTDLTMLFMPQSHANCLDHHLAWCILSVICHCNLLWSLCSNWCEILMGNIFALWWPSNKLVADRIIYFYASHHHVHNRSPDH